MISGVVAHPQPTYTNRTVALKSLSTTGSIAGGALSTLTVADATGFESGGKIIIAVGGEAGAGQRGSKGVGGTWPALSYANAAAMNADSGQAADTFAGLLDTGVVYQYVSSVWTINTANGYYTAKTVPKALVTTATISGNVLTLATPATVATTNATVYFDNLATWDAAVALGGTRVSLNVGAGTFAASEQLVISDKDNWRLKGAGIGSTIFKWPDGLFPAASDHMISLHDDGVVAQDFTVHGNYRLNGFGLCNMTETSTPGTRFHRGVYYGVGQDGGENPYSENGKIKRVHGIDVFNGVVAIQYCVNCWAYNCTATVTEAPQQYTQWQFILANTIGGGTVDCIVDSDVATAAFALFLAENGSHIRPTSWNGLMEANTSSGSYIDPTIVFGADTEAPATSADNPLININSNVGNLGELPDYVADGFIVRSPSMVQEGYYNDNNDTFTGLVVNEFNSNVTVTDGYYEAPDYLWPSTKYGAWGFINDAAENCNVDGFTVVGKSRLDAPNFNNIGVNCTSINITADVDEYPVLVSTWNPADKSAGITLATNNISAERTGAEDGNTDCVRCNAGHTTGDYHFEILLNTDTPQGYDAYGLGNASMPLSSASSPGTDNDSIAVFDNDNGTTSSVFLNNAAVATLDFPLAAGTVLVFEKRGTLLFIGKTTGNFNGSGAADPVTGVGGIDISGITGDLFPVFGAYDVNVAATLNTGGPAFARTPSAGFSDWGTGAAIAFMIFQFNDAVNSGYVALVSGT